MPAGATTRTTRRFPAGIVLLICLALCPAACQRQPDDGRTRIELWTLALRPRFTAYMEDLIARFEREHPSIDVVWVDVPFDAVQRKFLAAAAAGRAPDVINLSDGFYSRFVALGGIAELSGALPGDAHQTYLPGALRLCVMDGKLYALPWYLGTSVMFVNEKLLAEGRLSATTIGKDWPTLRRQAVEFHDRTGKFLFCPMLGQETRLPQGILQEGLSPLRAKPSGEGLESNLDDPRIVQFISDWIDLYRSGALPTESAVGGHAPMIDLYQNGRTAMLITGANFLERIRDAAPDVYRHTAILPAPRGRLGKFGIATMLLCVSSQSKHPKESAELAWFITNAENQLAFAKIVNILPSTPASLSDEHFAFPSNVEGEAPAEPNGAAAEPNGAAAEPNAAPARREARPPPTTDKLAYARALSAQSLANAVSFIQPLPAWPELIKSFEERIKSALLDGADVRETLKQIGEDWNGILDSHAPILIPSPGAPGEG